MAAKKASKKTAKKTESKKAVSKAAPVPGQKRRGRPPKVNPPAEPPTRIQVNIGPLSVWVDSNVALQYMILETATKDFTFEDLASYTARYRLAASCFLTEDAKEPTVLFSSGMVNPDLKK